MKKIVAINCSPRINMNTGTLVREAAKGAESEGAKEFYTLLGYRKTVKAYQKALTDAVGSTKVMIAGDTLQVKDHSRFNRTMFDPAAKQKRHENVFPKERKEVFELGAQMVSQAW